MDESTTSETATTAPAAGSAQLNEQVSGRELTATLSSLFRELLEGRPRDEPVWMISGGHESGAYGTTEGLSAEQASRELNGTTLAAHVEHLRWALQLVNDYFDGQAPTADWSASWSVKEVDEAGWEDLKAGLRKEGEALLENLETRQRWNDEMAKTGALASLGHTAYHLGALRQLRKRLTDEGSR